MTLNEYQKLALRTAGEECRSLGNCAMGLAGEAGECYEAIIKRENDNIIKELGDLAWYIAVCAEVINVPLEQIDYPNEMVFEKLFDHEISEIGTNIVIYACKCTDIIKKHVYHHHELDSHALIDVLGILMHFISFCAWLIDHTYTLDIILQKNVDKLRKRYPDGFEVEKSLNRAEDTV